jgi:hypothetical protein
MDGNDGDDGVQINPEYSIRRAHRPVLIVNRSSVWAQNAQTVSLFR